MKLKLFNIDFDKLVETATQEALDDVLPDERLEQKRKTAQMRNFKAPKKQKKSSEDDVDEAEELFSDKNHGLREPVKAKKSELPEITLGRIVDKLNSIRAGASLKDKGTQKELNDYFTRLNGNERIALYAFLSGLEKIMGTAGDEAIGDKVKTPDKEPYKIKMKKDAPKVDKTPAAGEDSPIVVGESANKSREKQIIRSNR